MNKETDRILVKEYSEDDVLFFGGTIENVISILQDFKNEKGWEGIECDKWGEYHLYRHRPETDAEYQKRMKLITKQENRNKKNKEKRLRLYEELKQEFG